jgi:hypothetical protein
MKNPIVGKIIINIHQNNEISYSTPTNQIIGNMKIFSQLFTSMANNYLMMGSDFIRTSLVVCALLMEKITNHYEEVQRSFLRLQQEEEPVQEEIPRDKKHTH